MASRKEMDSVQEVNMDVLRRFWRFLQGWLGSRITTKSAYSPPVVIADPSPAEVPLPQPSAPSPSEPLPKPLPKSASQLLLEAWARAQQPQAPVIYLHFDSDGRGQIIDGDQSSGGGPDIIIGPVCNFPLRPRPKNFASKGMLALQDGKPFQPTTPTGFSPNWPTQEAVVSISASSPAQHKDL